MSGLSLNLSPGTYWLNVAPIGSGTGSSFLMTTSGINAVGSPAGNNGNAFFDSICYGNLFVPTASINTTVTNFSMGIVGTDVIPEPTNLALLGLGVAATLFSRRRPTRRI